MAAALPHVIVIHHEFSCKVKIEECQPSRGIQKEDWYVWNAGSYLT